MTSQSAAILVSGVERRFGRLRVLRGVDLSVEAGHTVALFGSNGAGKTTLLRVIAGLCRPHGGNVELFGEQLPGGPSLRRRIGVVAHESFLYGDLTARENLRYYARLYRVDDRRRVELLLAQVELLEAAGRPVRTYSRGMVQRLALARAVLHQPRLLLMDEPFTGLDPHGATTLARVLAELRADGVTTLVTTHDFERGLDVADRAVLLDRGRIVWCSGAELPGVAAMHAIYDRETDGH